MFWNSPATLLAPRPWPGIAWKGQGAGIASPWSGDVLRGYCEVQMWRETILWVFEQTPGGGPGSTSWYPMTLAQALFPQALPCDDAVSMKWGVSEYLKSSYQGAWPPFKLEKATVSVIQIFKVSNCAQAWLWYLMRVSLLVRVLQRNRTNRMSIHGETYYKELAHGTMELTSPKICSWEAGDPGKLVV